ncbi:MAG: hypothetical protein DMF06_12915 [Verrucomicrobia bacterium]|nr:MAG: hypothetical protein DMF06_12915 [Verrucomicrobiota bacterium]
MKQLFTPFRILGATLLLALATGCATTTTTASHTDLLTAAGFRLMTADNPKKQEVLNTLPKDQLSVVTYKGKTFYVQPAAAANQAYVGTPKEYQAYQQLRVAKQISNDNLMAAQMNQDAMMGWGNAWGPGFYGGFYGGRYR